MSVSATVDLAPFRDARTRKLEDLPRFIRACLEEAGAIVKQEMEANAPVRTGALRSSIRVFVEGNSVSITPTVPYAIYVNEGTRPSPGRYVPAIGKRLVNPTLPSFGMHPGVMGQHFVERAGDASQARITELFTRILGGLAA